MPAVISRRPSAVKDIAVIRVGIGLELEDFSPGIDPPHPHYYFAFPKRLQPPR